MRSKNVVYLAIGVVIGILLSAGTVALAGSLDPASGPTNPASQMYTLQQIYNRLTTGAAGTKMTAFTEPSSGPGTGTMVTLDQLMAAAPAVHTNAATQTYIVSGTVVWGLSENAWGVITGTRPYLPILKTGVTTCYLSLPITTTWHTCVCGTANCPAGQDGALQMGLAPLGSRFTVISGTVIDNMTGLIWLQNANCAMTHTTWGGAFAYVDELNTSGTMAGHNCGDTSNGGSHQTDWRLPNVHELHSLNDFGRYNPSLPDGHPFLNVEPQWYWTSTPHGGPDPEFHLKRAFYVSMYGGRVFHEPKENNNGGDAVWYNLFTWPVRGGQR